MILAGDSQEKINAKKAAFQPIDLFNKPSRPSSSNVKVGNEVLICQGSGFVCFNPTVEMNSMFQKHSYPALWGLNTGHESWLRDAIRLRSHVSAKEHQC